MTAVEIRTLTVLILQLYFYNVMLVYSEWSLCLSFWKMLYNISYSLASEAIWKMQKNNTVWSEWIKQSNVENQDRKRSLLVFVNISWWLCMCVLFTYNFQFSNAKPICKTQVHLVLNQKSVHLTGSRSFYTRDSKYYSSYEGSVSLITCEAEMCLLCSHSSFSRADQSVNTNKALKHQVLLLSALLIKVRWWTLKHTGHNS